MQPVDPFIPVKRPKQRPKTVPRARLVHAPVRTPYRHPHTHAQTSPRELPLQARPPLRPQPNPPKALQELPKGRLRRIGGIILQAFILLLLLAVGFLARSSIFGQAMIIIYAIVALIIKIESRTTFLLALLSLGVVLIGSLRSDANLASTFAIYAFLLLIVGTISLSREVRDEI